MVLIALHFFLCTLHYFSSHTGIKLNPLICFMTRKNRRHQSKDDFWGQRFKQHIILWGLPNRSASMQSTILLYAAGTSYDLRGKFPFQFQKGGGQWTTYCMSGLALSHKGKNMAASWGFSQNLIILKKDFSRGIQGKNEHCTLQGT